MHIMEIEECVSYKLHKNIKRSIVIGNMLPYNVDNLNITQRHQSLMSTNYITDKKWLLLKSDDKHSYNM